MQWSIITVARGMWHVTERFLRTVQETVGREVELIYVDNGSPDKEAWHAVSQCVVGRREFTPVKMIRFSPGVCLSKCWNSAFDIASGERILIANNDIIFHQLGWLEKFDEALADPTVGVTGIVGMSWNNIPFIQGSLFAVLRNVYDLVGPFDERFEFTCEDIDYSKRIQDRGYRIHMIQPELQPDYLYHEGHATRNYYDRLAGVGSNPENTYSTFREMAHISRLRFVYKWNLPIRIDD